MLWWFIDGLVYGGGFYLWFLVDYCMIFEMKKVNYFFFVCIGCVFIIISRIVFEFEIFVLYIIVKWLVYEIIRVWDGFCIKYGMWELCCFSVGLCVFGIWCFCEWSNYIFICVMEFLKFLVSINVNLIVVYYNYLW